MARWEQVSLLRVTASLWWTFLLAHFINRDNQSSQQVINTVSDSQQNQIYVTLSDRAVTEERHELCDCGSAFPLPLQHHQNSHRTKMVQISHEKATALTFLKLKEFRDSPCNISWTFQFIWASANNIKLNLPFPCTNVSTKKKHLKVWLSQWNYSQASGR